jgi:hypothetical protein
MEAMPNQLLQENPDLTFDLQSDYFRGTDARGP